MYSFLNLFSIVVLRETISVIALKILVKICMYFSPRIIFSHYWKRHLKKGLLRKLDCLEIFTRTAA